MTAMAEPVISWALDKEDESSLWIFTLSGCLTNEQAKEFKSKVAQFLSGWKSHGENPQGDFFLWKNQVLFLSALHEPSGCGQDELHRQVKSIALEWGMTAYRGEKLIFLGENDVLIKDRSEFQLNQLEGNELWLNTGLFRMKSLKNSGFLIRPEQVF